MEKVKRTIERVAKPGYEYELYIHTAIKVLAETSSESVESLLKAQDTGIGIRVFRNGKIGFAYTTDLSEESLIECYKRAVEICELSPEDDTNKPFCARVEGELNNPYDSTVLYVTPQDLAQRCIQLEGFAKTLDNRIKGVRKLSLKGVYSEVYHFNTCGIDYHYASSSFISTIGVLAQEGEDSSISYDFRASRYLADLPLEDMVKDAVFKAVSQLNPSDFESKVMPTVFFRDAFASLLEAFSSVFLGDSLIKDKTMLKGKEGQIIASEVFTLIDDGTIEKGLASSPVDAEGILTRRNLVVKNGVFKGFLHSYRTALKSGQEPTGNSVRDSFKTLPTSGITNLFVEPSNTSFEDLTTFFPETLLVLDLMGLHTVDPISGDFSLGASGIILKEGKEVKRVRGITISGNFLEVLKNIRAVGNDLVFYGNVGSPSVLVERLTVGA
ncbi:TldD/PmbA family protein [Thermocrinis minervae]|uniref:PmbA protein n=1 Tax=Thermocrinis minervae TaxID=381751 RepID=A0A1M6QZW2_9AQUI|nr:TldD/PmbA family protein [Thermocrinis minervae]SHK25690.1 PmbA protein [Thermocrinis minervae]